MAAQSGRRVAAKLSSSQPFHRQRAAASASRATGFNPLRRIEGLPARPLPLGSPRSGDFPTCRRTTACAGREAAKNRFQKKGVGKVGSDNPLCALSRVAGKGARRRFPGFG